MSEGIGKFADMSMIDRRRIARNTLLLYLRMGLVMLVSLYASRVVLASLGETDYGLYNVIGGIVVMFAFLNGAMNAGCNRYYATALGKQDAKGLHKVFSVNVLIFLVLAAGMLVLCETLGLWLLEKKMTIPPERMHAARAVYQISIFSFLAGVVAIPFRSLITAREKMKVHALISVLEALGKLLAALLLAVSPFDRLVFYALGMLLVSLAANLAYIIYCFGKFPECKGKLDTDSSLAGEIIRFNLWGVIGSTATIGKNQGVNILLNMFYGPAVNAARGIANQVYVNVYQFVQNYVLAFNPQIVKSWAAGERQEMSSLVFQASKFSYYLLFAVALPLMLEMPAVLDIWLVEVPEHTVAFATIMMITALVDSMHDPLYYSVQASGQVKWYNILVGGSQLLAVVLVYLTLKLATVPPESVFLIILAFTIVAQIIRIILTHKYVGLNISEYLRRVLLPVLLVTLLSSLLPCFLVHFAPQTLWRLLATVLLSLLCTGTAVWTVGLESDERKSVKSLIQSKLHRQ